MTNVWIEGIGDIAWMGIFSPLLVSWWMSDLFYFKCFIQYQEVVYLYDKCKDCYCTRPPENNIANISLSNILIFPNPTNAQLRITNYESRIKYIELYGIVGNLLQSIHIDDNEIDMNLQELQTGIYFVKIITDNGISIQKIVKQ